jgi:hypothetical protein
MRSRLSSWGYLGFVAIFDNQRISINIKLSIYVI